MSGKQVAVLIGFAGLLWHVGSIIVDAERCKRGEDGDAVRLGVVPV